MKKVFKIEDLDCPNCAAELEKALNKVEGVKGVSISFLTGKLTVEAEDEGFDGLMKKLVKTARKVEPDCTIII